MNYLRDGRMLGIDAKLTYSRFCDCALPFILRYHPAQQYVYSYFEFHAIKKCQSHDISLVSPDKNRQFRFTTLTLAPKTFRYYLQLCTRNHFKDVLTRPRNLQSQNCRQLLSKILFPLIPYLLCIAKGKNTVILKLTFKF